MGNILDNILMNIGLIMNMGIKIITANSSIYAEEIFSKLGFIKTNEIQEMNGIKYIPMEYKI